MKKLRAWWCGVPRPVRILRNLLLVVILVGLIWLFRGCPALTVEQAYRRACARNLIEPGEIITTMQGDWSSRYSRTYFGYDGILAAKSDHGVILYGYQRRHSTGQIFPRFGIARDTLYYREGRKTVSVMTLRSNGWFSEHDSYVEVPLVLFDEVPKAVRAELDLYLDTSGVSNGTPFEGEYEYHLESTRKQSGLFEFCIQTGDGENEIGPEAHALSSFCWMFNDYNSYTSYPASVRLYDRNDVLIYEEDLLVQSVAAQAHMEREREGA